MFDDSSSSPGSSPLPCLLRSAHSHRATKAADIAHLLDPSYSSAPTHHSQIYIDNAGEAHDPDFRFFAVRASPKRRSIPELVHDHDDEDDDVDDEGVSFYSARRPSLDSYAPRPSSRGSHTHTYTSEPPSSPFSYDAYLPIPREHDREHPYEHEHQHEYDCEYDYDYDWDAEPRREGNKLRRRRASSAAGRVPPAPPPSPAWTSTPSHTLRRRWHVLWLRTQVAAFRARRRFAHAIHIAA